MHVSHFLLVVVFILRVVTGMNYLNVMAFVNCGARTLVIHTSRKKCANGDIIATNMRFFNPLGVLMDL